MVINSTKPILKVLREVQMPMAPVIIYIVFVAWADLEYHLEEFNFPITLIATLGTLIGLLLAFRTNSSYARWWEARTLWGAIVNDSRTWTRQLLTFLPSSNETGISELVIKQMSYRQIAYCYALSRELRRQDPIQDLSDFLSEPEIAGLKTSQNVANDILLEQGRELRKRYDQKELELYQFVELERTLIRLTNSMGGCERIKNTPFPTSYSRMVDGLIYLFAFFLPFGLFEMNPAGLIGTSLSMTFAYLVIDRVAIYLQDPFNNHPSDTPVLSLSRTIEINIKQMLGETDLPEKTEPIDGVLY